MGTLALGCRAISAIAHRQQISLMSRRFSHHVTFRRLSYNNGVNACGGKDDYGSILSLSPSNWPEPNATAAGTRTMSLLQHFASSPTSPFNSVHFGCGAKLPESLLSDHSQHNTNNKINWHQIKPNRSDDMKNLLQSITDCNGPIRAVVFDRFYAEEAYSFRIREHVPNALLVLDMQDLHSLRIGRQCLVEEASSEGMMTKQLMKSIMEYDPTTYNNHNIDNDGTIPPKKWKKAYDTFLREIASIHRCDLVLVCSSEEMSLLESWGVPKWKMVHASFFVNCDNISDGDNDHAENNNIPRTYEERKDFVTIGGFKHAPNVDSIHVLKKEIWPMIREQLPHAKLHICGAYPTPQILAMHDELSGFIVHGYVDNLEEVLTRSRVLLAPLRFGAGNKGKIIDAWRYGCPVVSTPIGAEGMRGKDADGSWGGLIKDNTDEFVSAAVQLYTQKDVWQDCQSRGSNILTKQFNGDKNLPIVTKRICDGMIDLKKLRQANIIGSILWRDTNRSTEYFSRWIELKESLLIEKEDN